MNEHPCYTDDWQRTRPDYVIHLPHMPGQRDEYADHIHVFPTPGGDLMCIWTQASYESAPDTRIVHARSDDGGRTWTPCTPLAEPLGPNLCPGLAFPLVSRSGRIYCLYSQHRGVGDLGLWAGPLHVQVSDDDGCTWVDTGVELPFRRTAYDHPDPGVPPECIVWQQPIRDAQDRLVTGFSRWSSPMVYPRPLGGNRNHLDTQCELIRFDNIDEGP